MDYTTNYNLNLPSGDDSADVEKLNENAEIIDRELFKKVDSVAGKGLSTEDFTTAEKTKLNNIESGAEVNDIDTIKVNGTTQQITNKSVDISVPVKTSDLTNDSGFIDNSVNNLQNYYDKTAIDAELNGMDTLISAKQNKTDNTLTTTNKNIVPAINEVNSIAKGAQQAISYDSYQTMITAFNSLASTAYNVGQSIYIVTLEVPDLWISSVESTSEQYTYISDEEFLNTLKDEDYHVQVGYYKLSPLETGKVDLTDYYTKSEANTLLADKADKSTTYTKTETDTLLSAKQNSTDNSLETTSKNVVGAINENFDSIANVEDFVGYIPSDVIGLQVDFENNTFKRLGGAEGKTAGSDFNQFQMFGGRKRCNVSNNGTINAYYGDANYIEDGTNGQVMVYQPKFYYKVVPLKLEKNTDTNIGYHIRKINYYVSDIKYPGFKLHPAFYDENGNEVDYILFSAYEGSMWDASAEAYVNDSVDTSIAYASGDLLCSVAGKKPISGLRTGMGTKANFEAMSNNRGSGWHLETIKATSANQLLMIVEIGMMNTQTGIGRGIDYITDNSSYNCSSLTGSTASLGNGSGSAASTVNEKGGTETTETATGKVAVTYRGVENPWGNIFKHIQGVNIWGNGSMAGGQPYVCNDLSSFNESSHSGHYEGAGFTIPNASGYIKAMGYGNPDFDWLLMPSEIGGDSSLPVGDCCYVASNLNGYKIALLGGNWAVGTDDGGFYWYCLSDVGIRYRDIGGRLLYVPTSQNSVSGYRKIVDVTLTAQDEATSLVFEADSNNNAFVLERAKIFVFSPIDSTLTANCGGYINIKSRYENTYLGNYGALTWQSNTNPMITSAEIITNDDLPTRIRINTNNWAATAKATNVTVNWGASLKLHKQIEGIKIYINGDITFKAGTRIVIYGVDK